MLINGSPNKNGFSMTLADAIFDENTVHHAYEMSIESCTDCGFCDKRPACIFDDDMDAIISALHHDDTLILASPIYFGALSDKLLAILNRLQMLFKKKFTHKQEIPDIKRLYIVATCGAGNAVMFDGAHLTLTILKQLFNAETARLFTLKGTDAMHPETLTKDKAHLIDHYRSIVRQ